MEYTKNNGTRANLPEPKKANGMTIFIAIVTALVVFVGGMFAYSAYDHSRTKAHFQEVSTEEANNRLKNESDAIVIMGLASCIHCQNYKPVAKQFGKNNNTKFYYIDLAVGTNQADMAKYPDLMTQGTPTTYYFHGGVKVGSVEGERTIDQLKTDTDSMRAKGFELPKV